MTVAMLGRSKMDTVLPHLLCAVTCFETTIDIAVIVFKLHPSLLIKLHFAECRKLGL